MHTRILAGAACAITMLFATPADAMLSAVGEATARAMKGEEFRTAFLTAPRNAGRDLRGHQRYGGGGNHSFTSPYKDSPRAKEWQHETGGGHRPDGGHFNSDRAGGNGGREGRRSSVQDAHTIAFLSAPRNLGNSVRDQRHKGEPSRPPHFHPHHRDAKGGHRSDGGHYDSRDPKAGRYSGG